MSREIKFRAWDKWDNSYFKEIEQLVIAGDGEIGIYDGSEWLGFGDYQDRFILEYYTGLKDKNGVDIYENDIIEISDMSYGDNDKHYGVVEYSDYAELVVGNILLSRVYKAIKVIGNIHENPEILE